MFEKFFSKYPYYQTIEKPVSAQIEAYRGVLPDSMLDVWEKQGWGIYMNGFIRLINPDDFLDIITDNVETATESIPFAVTAFGDILLWLKDDYVELISFRKEYRKIVESEIDFFFNDTLPHYEYVLSELKSEMYPEFVDKLGVPTYGQCYGYFPLLALGGSESVDHIQIVDLQVHIDLMAQASGPL